jgi:hypothetical protein
MKYPKIKTKLSLSGVSLKLTSKCGRGCKFVTHVCYNQDSKLSEPLAAASVVRTNI